MVWSKVQSVCYERLNWDSISSDIRVIEDKLVILYYLRISIYIFLLFLKEVVRENISFTKEEILNSITLYKFNFLSSNSDLLERCDLMKVVLSSHLVTIESAYQIKPTNWSVARDGWAIQLASDDIFLISVSIQCSSRSRLCTKRRIDILEIKYENIW